MAQIKKENLVGRQVYFKMSKKQFASARIYNLTPYKLYTLIADPILNPTLYVFKNDAGRVAYFFKPCCPHLANLTGWILKRRAK